MEKVSKINLNILFFVFIGLGVNSLYLFYLRKKILMIPVIIFNIVVIFYIFGLQLSIVNIIGGFQGFLNTFSITNLLLLTIFVFLTGRYYCSHMCPFGIFSEFLGFKGLQYKVPVSLNRTLKLIGIFYLLILILSYYFDTWKITYDMEILNYFFRFDTSDVFFISGIFFLFFSLFVNRFFCRYICPTGVLLSISRLSAPVKVNRIDNCVSCKRCIDVCPTGAIYKDDKGKIRIDALNCIDCYRCTNICNLQNKKTNSK